MQARTFNLVIHLCIWAEHFYTYLQKLNSVNILVSCMCLFFFWQRMNDLEKSLITLTLTVKPFSCLWWKERNKLDSLNLARTFNLVIHMCKGMVHFYHCPRILNLVEILAKCMHLILFWQSMNDWEKSLITLTLNVNPFSYLWWKGKKI